MLGNPYSYFGIILNSVKLFGTIFDEIYIERANAAGAEVKLMKVPLTYAPKDKVLARLIADPNLTTQAAVVAPLMSFEIVNMTPDPVRKLTGLGKTVVLDPTNSGKMKRQYNPVPWNINFRLYVYVKNAEDGTKIIEQIVPYFTPDWTPRVNLIPEMNVELDVPIILNDMSMEDVYTGSFVERQALTWTIDFTMKTAIYGPIKSKPIIKFANTRFFAAGSGATDAAEEANSTMAYTVSVQPALLANGSPTTNSAASVAVTTIYANSDFGFATTLTDVGGFFRDVDVDSNFA